MAAQAGDPELTGFDIFVLALSVLSIINMVLALAPFSAGHEGAHRVALGGGETNDMLLAGHGGLLG